jgi:hypothetical protein
LFSFVLAQTETAGEWSNSQILAVALGVIFALIAIGLVIASWTRWGQNKAITNCVVLAVLAHIGLLMYAYGTRVVAPRIGDGTAATGPMRVRLLDSVPTLASPESESGAEPTEDIQPWEQPNPNAVGDELIETLDSQIPEDTFADRPTTGKRSPPPLLISTKTEPFAALPEPLDLNALDQQPSEAVESQSQTVPERMSETIPDAERVFPEPPPAPERAFADSQLDPLLPDPQPPAAQPDPSAVPNVFTESRPPEQLTSSIRARPSDRLPDRQPTAQPVPNTYQMRNAFDKAQLVARFGGDANTEAAVDAALQWLARSQSVDGHWDAAGFGAGDERQPLGEDRGGAGQKADTAMTGLALLAFLGAGHSHTTGEYKQTVARALDYLIRSQMPSGDLSGPKQIGNDRMVRYARMYSHGIAGLAICEAYALTNDQRLRASADSAKSYTLAAQNGQTGGWRYGFANHGDPGDLSQFGWQAMLLKSAQAGGLVLKSETPNQLQRFLDSVRAGPSGGLATYQPRPGQSPTVVMTAEAFACRSLLAMPLDSRAVSESKNALLSQLPGSSEENLYYWYYATLAMFQHQGPDWPRWNDALKSTLVNSQVTYGDNAGSWEPTGKWAGYGGRVYSTAMACMCLEVYYRYLPMYQ